ncbi:DegT/DnrJ/EryC1/StrS family aminotransferase [Candidatus Micrarchaeota archaeon]|nr:DegT/DnrJ/EryC1/StrS family aminotransferase [Candidatus Micrarchaeota archaeon]
MTRHIPIGKPLLGVEEIRSVLKVLESGVLSVPSTSGGPMIQAFEKTLAEYVRCKHAIAVNSGTSALSVSLMALGVKAGDEVIVPSFTYGATANTVLLLGAKPLFIDIDPKTYNMDPDLIEAKITGRTKAIVPVHLFGLCADMDLINEIAAIHGLHVIEDAAQALGSEYKGKKAGNLGDVGCFSFYPGKVMTTGEGGAITTNNDELALRMRMIRNHGQEKAYEFAVLGSNYRMPEMEAAIGVEQLKKLPSFLEARRNNARRLGETLQFVSSLTLPFENELFKHNWYLYTIKLDASIDRDTVVQKLNADGIEARVYYSAPVHTTPLYRRLGFATEHLPFTMEASKSIFSLPVHPGVSPQDVDFMTGAVKKILG